ncbi:MAG: hypothetical protein QHH43_02145 [Candidatus Saccharicenans sp.]|jgi:hypothetical protein|nr:hypothetical protein [Candidatus Saccharicenans sp.]MDH7574545.1 hypothetical protein [Candidatus Saccharicenans sp.]
MAERRRATRTSDRQFLYIDTLDVMGREILRFDGLNRKPISPSPFIYPLGDERTHKFINASFLPFFALLSIPPSFN